MADIHLRPVAGSEAQCGFIIANLCLQIGALPHHGAKDLNPSHISVKHAARH
jgi:hypothetical protein